MQQNYQEPQKQFKQATSIRKITIQTLTPVINKLQEHVAFLLAQTSKLRQQNLLLSETVGNHKVMNEYMHSMSDRIASNTDDLDKKEKEHEKQKIQSQEEMQTITMKIDKIQRDLKRKQNKINDLYQRNTEQNNKTDQVKQDLQEIIMRCNQNVQECTNESRQLDHKLTNFNQMIEMKYEALKSDFQERSQKYNETDSKISLYMDQRQQLRQLITQTLETAQKKVGIEQYQYDWRVIRVQNDDLKRNVRQQIDSALTPEVRKFLPQIMERMEQLRKVDRLEQQFLEQQKKTQEMKNKHQQYIKTLSESGNNLQLELEQFKNNQNEQNKLIFDDIKDKINSAKQQASSQTVNLSNKTEKYVFQLKSLIKDQETSLKATINSLIEKSRKSIYDLVIEQIPEEQKKFYESIKQIFPMLDAMKEELNKKFSQLTQFSKKLQDELDNFSNRLIKVKGDVYLQMDQVRKKNRSIQQAIINIKLHFQSVGKIVSSFCQLFMLELSLGFSIKSQNDVFVTYNDGIICGLNKEDDGDALYRKTKSDSITFKRSALSTTIRLVDQLMSNQEYTFLKCQQNKPSDFFKLIKQGLVFAAYKKPEKKALKKQNKREESSREKNTKLPSLDQSKTIDVNNVGSLEKEYMSQTLNADFKSVTKKVQKPYKGRYSQVK